MNHKQSYATRLAKFEASKEQFSLKRMIDLSGNYFMVNRDNVLEYLKRGWTLDYTQVNIYQPTLVSSPDLKQSDYHKMVQLKRISAKRSVEYRQSVLIEYLENGWVLGSPPVIAGNVSPNKSRIKIRLANEFEMSSNCSQPLDTSRVTVKVLSL
jgi:hypothetical protein